MKWVKLVERESDFWKNYMMISSIGDIKKVFDCTIKERLTTRRGMTFIHWMNPKAVWDCSLQIEKKLEKDTNFIEKIKKVFNKSQNKLLNTNKLLEKLNFRNLNNDKLLRLYEQFCECYKELYAPFHLAVYIDSIENKAKGWLLNELIKNNSENEFNDYFRKLSTWPESSPTITNGLERRFENQKKLFEKLSSPILMQKFFQIIALLTWIRLESRKTFVLSHDASKNLFKEIGLRNNLTSDDIKWLNPLETRNLILKHKLPKEDKLKARKFASVLLFQSGRHKILEGKKADKFIRKEVEDISPNKKSDLIKGSVAYPGIVQGSVKIIIAQQDVPKMKKGDILVARMTTPDIMPAAQLAGAIVTDEGGITCHAAIISRELKIPCVVGTKFATKILKDGDLITVNANKGIIKKQEKND